ncbi:type III secretion HpaP family protein [Terasakiella pusilla]|uniref:type III secretion HpaP family protein n=1 Tax=Terasakiella pusilla TaxID=64973 RepID=UPI00048B411B|nr:type III secretion HpaP family protein [Terasakiella pusilla]
MKSVDSNYSTQNSRPADSRANEQTRPSEENQQDFRSAMKKRGDEGRKEGGQNPEQQQHASPFSPGAGILGGMSRGVQAPQQAAGAGQAGQLGELAQEIASRVMVAKGDVNSPGEVRIQLKDGMLQNTEVRVSVVDGKTQITFVSGNVDSANMLHQRSGDMQNELSKRLGDNVEVKVMSDDEARQSDQDGQSRNKQQYHPDEDDDGGFL